MSDDERADSTERVTRAWRSFRSARGDLMGLVFGATVRRFLRDPGHLAARDRVESPGEEDRDDDERRP